ncbi:hypothetical protein GCM10010294_28480 [Streptomyces griseoloalbus]|nr:hypothetical protein GCM10010294_28480 [Streptomyces griseoloalbus]
MLRGPHQQRPGPTVAPASGPTVARVPVADRGTAPGAGRGTAPGATWAFVHQADGAPAPEDGVPASDADGGTRRMGARVPPVLRREQPVPAQSSLGAWGSLAWIRSITAESVSVVTSPS